MNENGASGGLAVAVAAVEVVQLVVAVPLTLPMMTAAAFVGGQEPVGAVAGDIDGDEGLMSVISEVAALRGARFLEHFAARLDAMEAAGTLPSHAGGMTGAEWLALCRGRVAAFAAQAEATAETTKTGAGR